MIEILLQKQFSAIEKTCWQKKTSTNNSCCNRLRLELIKPDLFLVWTSKQSLTTEKQQQQSKLNGAVQHIVVNKNVRSNSHGVLKKATSVAHNVIVAWIAWEEEREISICAAPLFTHFQHDVPFGFSIYVFAVEIGRMLRWRQWQPFHRQHIFMRMKTCDLRENDASVHSHSSSWWL